MKILANDLKFARKKILLLARFTKNCTRKCARARSSFARKFWPLEKILLELARLENCKEEFLLGTRSARKLTCSFCSNLKNFRSVSALQTNFLKLDIEEIVNMYYFADFFNIGDLVKSITSIHIFFLLVNLHMIDFTA